MRTALYRHGYAPQKPRREYTFGIHEPGEFGIPVRMVSTRELLGFYDKALEFGIRRSRNYQNNWVAVDPDGFAYAEDDVEPSESVGFPVDPVTGIILFTSRHQVGRFLSRQHKETC